MTYIPSNTIFDRLRRRASVELFRKTLRLPKNTAIITFSFDDCPQTACAEGLRVLKKHDILGTYYISLGLQDQEDHQGLCFSEEDIRRLYEGGHEIACHSYSHLDATQVSIHTLTEDLRKNREEARNLLGDNVTLDNFAYPFGNMAPFVKRKLRNIYKTSRSVRIGINRDVIDLACLKAVEINEETAKDACQDAINDVIKNGGWLIFFTHDIRSNPSPYGCTPESFEKIVDRACATGAHILSVRDALSFLGVKAS